MTKPDELKTPEAGSEETPEQKRMSDEWKNVAKTLEAEGPQVGSKPEGAPVAPEAEQTFNYEAEKAKIEADYEAQKLIYNGVMAKLFGTKKSKDGTEEPDIEAYGGLLNAATGRHKEFLSESQQLALGLEKEGFKMEYNHDQAVEDLNARRDELNKRKG